MDVIEKIGRFLDPIIAVREDGQLLDAERQPPPAGDEEARRARPSIALVVPDAEVAFKILALNTEKAHNLREKSLEMIRMARALADDAATATERAASRSSSSSRRS